MTWVTGECPIWTGQKGNGTQNFGAKIMGYLFGVEWYEFMLLHSRTYAKGLNRPVSRLCAADKLATALTPSWIYYPLVVITGEIQEYKPMAEEYLGRPMTPWGWQSWMRRYMRQVAFRLAGQVVGWLALSSASIAQPETPQSEVQCG